MKTCAALVLALLSSATLAQGITLQATITQPLSASANGGSGPSSQSEPIGPLPAGGVMLSVGSLPVFAGLSCDTIAGLPVGSAGFTFQASGVNFFTPNGIYGFGTGGEIVLQLTAPVPTAMVMVATGAASVGASSTTWTEIDIDDDQVIDAMWVAGSGMVDDDGEFGLLVGPAGRSVRIHHYSFGDTSALVDLELLFHADASPLASYGTGCVDLTWERTATGDTEFRCEDANMAIGAFAFGLTQLQVPLPLAPGCLQLLDPLFLVTALPNAGVIAHTVPALALPPGFEVFVQAVTLATSGAMQTSNGLRMVGPN